MLFDEDDDSDESKVTPQLMTSIVDYGLGLTQELLKLKCSENDCRSLDITLE